MEEVVQKLQLIARKEKGYTYLEEMHEGLKSQAEEKIELAQKVRLQFKIGTY